MQPMAGVPPVPSGAVARDAWRELGKETRRELLRGELPHPDPAVAVVAVGYARAMLARSPVRQTLPLTAAAIGAVVTYAVVIAILDVNDKLPTSSAVTSLLPAILLVPLMLARRIRMRSRIIALHRMESVNAARLWSSERAAPAQERTVVPAPPSSAIDRPGPAGPFTGVGPAQPVVVRYSRRFLVRSFAVLAVFMAVVETAVLVLQDRLVALMVTALLLLVIVLTIYNTFARTRPQLPMMIMTSAGLELPSMGTRVAWSDIVELRIQPYRAGRSGRKGRTHAIAFVLTDPESFRAQLSGWWAKKTRTPLSVYGTPLVIADLALDHSAEQIAAAAAAFTNAPVRRFGPHG